MQEIDLELDRVNNGKTEKQPEGADFETAIESASYGNFNYILYFLSFLAMFSSTFETTTMAYVFPAAECDLDLDLADKGLLNAITYAGMISSAFLWGYLCDTFGRKKLLTLGFLLDSACFIFAGFAQSFTQLLVAKFMGGFIINGPFAALTAYLSEFHTAKYRARVQIILGTFLSFGNLVLPLLALIILPQEIHLKLNEYLILHSWNIYLLICSFPALLSGILFIFMPESPKFLMTCGRNQEALKIFQMVYCINTREPKESYPIKLLVMEKEQVDESAKKSTKLEKLSGGFQQIKPMFKPPYFVQILLVFGLQSLIMNSLNTLRLWLPQLYQAINDYNYKTGNTEESATLCQMLEIFQHKKIENTSYFVTEPPCVVNTNNSQVYTNSMIVAVVSIITYALAGTLINKLGKKLLLVILCISAGSMAISLYFSSNVETTVALSSLFIGLGGTSINVLLAVVVDLFPTTLRTMTVSLTMMCGRLGAMTGNMIFPHLLSAGCAPPFFYVGLTMMSCAILTLLLPNTDLKALQ